MDELRGDGITLDGAHRHGLILGEYHEEVLPGSDNHLVVEVINGQSSEHGSFVGGGVDYAVASAGIFFPKMELESRPKCFQEPDDVRIEARC